MNYNHLIETTLEVVLWSEEAKGLMRHIVYISHKDAILTIEHKGALLKYNISLEDANNILDLIKLLSPSLGNPIQKHRYWMTINSPCLKLEYKWNNPNDTEFHACNSVREFVFQLENKIVSMN